MTEAEFEQLIGLIPIFIISLIVGVGSFFTQGEPDDDKKTMIKNRLAAKGKLPDHMKGFED